MNLVAYEYLCCQLEDPGMLILSEFAGSAQSLHGNYQLIIRKCNN